MRRLTVLVKSYFIEVDATADHDDDGDDDDDVTIMLAMMMINIGNEKVKSCGQCQYILHRS